MAVIWSVTKNIYIYDHICIYLYMTILSIYTCICIYTYIYIYINKYTYNYIYKAEHLPSYIRFAVFFLMAAFFWYPKEPVFNQDFGNNKGLWPGGWSDVVLGCKYYQIG